VILVFYDPSQFADPLVVTMSQPEQVLELVLCINALETCGARYAAAQGRAEAAAYGTLKQRSRAHAVGTWSIPTIESFLDFSKAKIGDLIAATGGSGTEIRVATLRGFDCCVKIMDCSQYGQDSVDSMEKEISLLIMCKGCKHIVHYLHHDRAPTGQKQQQQLRLFMELFPGSLRKIIKSRADTQGYFTQKQVYILARRLIKALIFLHTQPQPIVHRDIKSDNFLVEEDLHGNFLRVKLTDFGSAKILTRGRTSSVDQGTSGYQAPEMVRGGGVGGIGAAGGGANGGDSNGGDANGDASSTATTLSYTTAVDIFAFGITLYEILALKRVYPNCQSRQEMEEALRNAEKYPPDLTIVPRQLLHFMLIVSPCLKRNYNERPTATELLQQLEKTAMELGISKDHQ